jgi:hypothetical protein
MTDYAFAKLLSWDRDSGQLVVQPLQIYGSAGPFSDWIIYVGTAISQAVADVLTQTKAARDAALGYRDQAVTNAGLTAADKAAVAQMKSDTLAARDAAQLAADNAGTFDPTNYANKTYVDGKIALLVNSAPAQLDTINELAAALGNDANYAGTVTASLGFRLRVDVNNQGLDATQQQNGRTNLGLGGSSVYDMAVAANIMSNTGAKPIGVDQAWASAAWIDLGNKSGSVVIDMNTGSRFLVRLAGNVTISAINAKNGQPLELCCIQDATGGRSVSWSGFLWPNGVVPAVNPNPGNWAVMYSGTYNPWAGGMVGAGWKVN